MKLPSKIKKIIGSKNFIKMTESGHFYDNETKKYLTYTEVQDGLKNGKYMFVAENSGSYMYEAIGSIYIKAKNNKYVDIYFIAVDSRVKKPLYDTPVLGTSLWKSTCPKTCGFRIYSDRTHTELYYDEERDELLFLPSQKNYSFYSSREYFMHVAKNIEKSDNNPKLRSGMKLSRQLINIPAVETKRIFFVSAITNGYRVKNTENQKNILKEVFKDNCKKFEEKFKSPIEFDSPSDFAKFLNVSLKINNSNEDISIELVSIKKELLKKIPGEERRTNNICRYDDYLIFIPKRDYKPWIFYNIKNKRKYALSKYYILSTPNISKTFGEAMKIYNLFYFWYSSFQRRDDEYGKYPKDIYGILPYCCELKNKKWKNINYKECLKDTIGIDYIENIADASISITEYKYDVTYNYDQERNSNDRSYEYNVGYNSKVKIKDLMKYNLFPSEIFAFVCCKNGFERLTEQLIKTNRFNLLRAITFQLGKFVDIKRLAKMADTYDKQSKNPIDLSGKNLNKILGFSNSKIDLIEKIFSEYENFEMKSGTYNKVIDTPISPYEFCTNFSKIFDNFDNINNDNMVRLIKLLGRNYYEVNSCIENIKKVLELGKNKFPRQILMEKVLTFMEPSGNSYMDYLRMRSQYSNYFGEENLRHFPIFPEKSRAFKRIMPNQTRSDFVYNLTYICGQTGSFEEVYEDGKLIGAYLNLDGVANMRYLHEELHETLQVVSNKMKEDAFQRALSRSEKFIYKGKELSVIRPQEINDLIKESDVLKHCVRSFVDPIINGTENVLFIRRNDMIDTPYYTMAISNEGIISQIHCYCNQNLSKEDQENVYKNSKIPSYSKTFDLISFLKEWAKAVGIDQKQITEKYGVKCARR